MSGKKVSRLIVVMLAICPLSGLCASPASRPVPETPADKVTKLSDAIVKKQSELAHDWAEERKPLAEEFELKKRELEEARSGTNSQAKLNASAAFNKARLALEAAEKEHAKTGNRELDALRSELTKATEELGIYNLRKTPGITLRQLKLMGDKYADRSIKVKASFVDGFNPLSEGIFPRLARITGRSNAAMANYVGFHVEDENGDIIFNCLADKERWGELIATVKRGKEITLYANSIGSEELGLVILSCVYVEVSPE